MNQKYINAEIYKKKLNPNRRNLKKISLQIKRNWKQKLKYE